MYLILFKTQGEEEDQEKEKDGGGEYPANTTNHSTPTLTFQKR